MPHSEITPPRFAADFVHQLELLYRWRRDVRRFRTDPLSEDTLEQVIGLAALAPSVGLSQPWRFVKVASAECRDAVRAIFTACNQEALSSYTDDRASLYARLKLAGLDEAPVHLAVFVDRGTERGHGLGRRTMPETLAYSVVGAVHGFWLAARALGIGVGWVSILDAEQVKAALQLPDDWHLVAYLCVGYPQEEHLDPELERAGWEQRLPARQVIFER
jgi:5,6-dimethylbenzimidazole synthase